MRIAEEVRAGSRRRAGDERALGVQAPRARRRQLDEVGDRLGPALLRKADQRDQDLRRRRGIGERPVARRRGRAEEVRERREAEAAGPAAEQAPGEPDRVDDRRRDAPAGEPLDGAVEEAHVEPRVVRDEHGVAGEREEAPDREIGRRGAAHVAPADPREGRDRRRQRHARVDEASRRWRPASSASTRWAPISTIRERAGERPVVSRSKTTNDGVLERVAAPGGSASPTAAPRQREPRVARDDVVEQRPRDRRRRRARARRASGRRRRPGPARGAPRRARRAGRRHRRRVASADPTRTYVRVQAQRERAPWKGPFRIRPRRRAPLS